MATASPERVEIQRIVTPNPDPTALTTQALLREIAMLRDLLEVRIIGLDKTAELLRSKNEKLGDLIGDATRSLERHEEKFLSIATQFTERDTRTEQTSRDSKVAVDAALQAAKEAVGEQNKSSALAIAKSEAATTKQIDQIGVMMSTIAPALNSKIDDIKERITTIEGRSEGKDDTSTKVLAMAALIVSVLIGVFQMLHPTLSSQQQPYYVAAPIPVGPTTTTTTSPK